MLNNSNSAAPVHSPPPPLQPIVDETLTGLYHYFGSGAGAGVGNGLAQHQPPQPPAPLLSSIRLVCNTSQPQQQQQQTQLMKTSQQTLNSNNDETAQATSMDHDGQIESLPTHQQQQPVFSFSREVTAMSLQEKRHTLNRKLAQRAPKHELVERGILPRKFLFKYL